MRSSWIFWMGPKSNDVCPHKGKERRSPDAEEKAVRRQRHGVMRPQTAEAGRHQQLNRHSPLCRLGPTREPHRLGVAPLPTLSRPLLRMTAQEPPPLRHPASPRRPSFLCPQLPTRPWIPGALCPCHRV